VAGVQAAPLGSTVAIEDASANDSVPHVVRKSASVAAVDRRDDRSQKRRTTKKEKPAPRQFERAPSRVDNLKEIKGIGPVLERMLNRVGVYQFRQIASWSDEDIDYFDTQLADFRGRIRRDNWPSGASAAYNRKYD
jgi:NADH-quinone oxidoreductase subunit E